MMSFQALKDEIFRPASPRRPARAGDVLGTLRKLEKEFPNTPMAKTAAEWILEDMRKRPDRYKETEWKRSLHVARRLCYSQDDLGFVGLYEIAEKEIGYKNAIDLTYLYGDVCDFTALTVGLRCRRRMDKPVYREHEETFLIHIDDVHVFLDRHRKKEYMFP